MPHDGTLPERRGPGFRPPAWTLALALTVFFILAIGAITVATGALLIALPALAVVAAGYAIYYVVAAKRRRSRPWIDANWSRGLEPDVTEGSVIDDMRTGRRRSRLSGSSLP